MRVIALILLTTSVLSSGCANMPAESSGPIHHVVLLWFKPGTGQALIDEAMQRTQALQGIPGVVSVTTAQPIPSSRPIVDASFDRAVYITFSDREAMERYEQEPRHTALVRELIKPNLQRIQIYDFDSTVGAHP